jgi:hypothetical protein
MRLFATLVIGGLMALSSSAQEQDTTAKPVPVLESKGLPPRASADEYQAKAQAGAVTIGAEFVEHSVPTPDAIYSTEDYVVVETGLFGAADARLKLSPGDFSLRINDKKAPLPSQPYELVSRTLKDPEWAPPKDEDKLAGTSISSGKKDNGEPPPAPIHMPIERQLAMEQRVKNAGLLGGDRALPQAGLLFFEFRGKGKNIRSVELIYDGPAGKATLTLQP